MFYSVFPSPIGPLTLVSDVKALTGLWLPTEHPMLPNAEQNPELPVLLRASAWLSGYFAGHPGVIDFPLDPAGTPFQKRVWAMLLTIPYGKTTTYGAIAREISPTMSAQAVGQAAGRNPVSIIIPCHRVLGAGGQLTGYAGGLENKKWLLRHEEETK